MCEISSEDVGSTLEDSYMILHAFMVYPNSIYTLEVQIDYILTD